MPRKFLSNPGYPKGFTSGRLEKFVLALKKSINYISNPSLMSKVLVLNASYEPLNLTSWRRAVVLLIKGKAEQLEGVGDRVLYADLPMPSVIRLRQYVRIPYNEVPLTRRNLLHRDGGTCQYCGNSGELMTLDHVIPRSRGGKDVWENVVIACGRCNTKKGNRTPKEAGMPLAKPPHRPHSSLFYEVSRHLKTGTHQEWRKYVIGA
jgi:5-methylcytosine-specific restriction endonuclease McrA